MPKKRVQVWQYQCCRCEHEWLGRMDADPRVCAKCKSPYWNTPRRRDVASAASKGKK